MTPPTKSFAGLVLEETELHHQKCHDYASAESPLANFTRRIKTALADDVPAFVRAVYQETRDYNQLVFTSAVFGVQACTFS